MEGKSPRKLQNHRMQKSWVDSQLVPSCRLKDNYEHFQNPYCQVKIRPTRPCLTQGPPVIFLCVLGTCPRVQEAQHSMHGALLSKHYKVLLLLLFALLRIKPRALLQPSTITEPRFSPRSPVYYTHFLIPSLKFLLGIQRPSLWLVFPI